MNPPPPLRNKALVTMNALRLLFFRPTETFELTERVGPTADEARPDHAAAKT